jgi:hypothetical protein
LVVDRGAAVLLSGAVAAAEFFVFVGEFDEGVGEALSSL